MVSFVFVKLFYADGFDLEDEFIDGFEMSFVDVGFGICDGR